MFLIGSVSSTCPDRHQTETLDAGELPLIVFWRRCPNLSGQYQTASEPGSLGESLRDLELQQVEVTRNFPRLAAIIFLTAVASVAYGFRDDAPVVEPAVAELAIVTSPGSSLDASLPVQRCRDSVGWCAR